MTDSNQNPETHIKKPFGFLRNSGQEVTNAVPAQITYTKSDGTKVTEQQNPIGKSVMEIYKDGTVISRLYDKHDIVRQDYIRRLNVELVHRYDETALMTDEFMNVYDENNKLARKIEKFYDYYDSSKKMIEIIIETPSDIKTYMKYDESGERIEKIVERGTVKTWYDANERPVKRETDRGAGGLIIEDLTK